DHADEERDHRPPAIGIRIANLIGHPGSDQGPKDAQHDGHDDADALPARHDEPRERADNSSDDDRTDDGADHFLLLTLKADNAGLPALAKTTQLSARLTRR